MTIPRIGFGYDVHQLVEGRKLIVCGVDIPHSKGLLGHSDADVAIHALIDALLGAAGLGDIGSLFPDTDSRYKDIDSRILLRSAMDRIIDAGFQLGNTDITIVAQEPKMKAYVPEMKRNLSADMKCGENAVSIKATTTEHLGFEGRKEGISAYAVALLIPAK